MYQLAIFTEEPQIKAQKKLLQDLIDLKSEQLFNKEFHNFYGTPEEVQVRRVQLNKKISNYRERVKKSFPGIL
ncbi:hypothetical protein P4S95_16285 [Aneurinibacillus aneurinilyticus]|uniref:hypothetical protein n=1 Tax=Aneurinibacillus aneurinilyticus TaxID=1391 RepID=UPI002E2271B2|nr:hypothetical protein [Aneurinibacillus aneurinilyticus]